MSSVSHFLNVFATVTGRQPIGRHVSHADRTRNEQRLSVSETPQSASDPKIQIPDLLVEFDDLFGEEASFKRTYFTLLGVEQLIGALGHIIFASDPRSGLYFGISHYLLRFPDPPVVVTSIDNRDNVFGWIDYSDSLVDCLVEFACRNLCDSMPYILFVDNANIPLIFDELATFDSLPLIKSSEPPCNWRIFYAPGTIILHNVTDHSLVVGLDTFPRAQEFQAKHAWEYDEVFVDPS